MEEAVFPYPSQPKKSTKTKRAVIIGVILLIALIGGFFLLRQPKKTEEKKAAVIENQAPTPTEKPKIDKKTVKIQVVNGTGTPGQAGLVVKALKDAGYSSDNIKTGNAEKFDTTVSSIKGKENFEEIIVDIKDVLKSTFSDITVGSTLDKDSEFDIVVLTGGKIFTEATPTPKAVVSASPTPLLTSAPTSTPSPTVSPTPTP